MRPRLAPPPSQPGLTGKGGKFDAWYWKNNLAFSTTERGQRGIENPPPLPPASNDARHTRCLLALRPGLWILGTGTRPRQCSGCGVDPRVLHGGRLTFLSLRISRPGIDATPRCGHRGPMHHAHRARGTGANPLIRCRARPPSGSAQDTPCIKNR